MPTSRVAIQADRTGGDGVARIAASGESVGLSAAFMLPDAEPWAVPKIMHVEDVAQEQIREVLGKIEGDSGPLSGR